MKAKRKLDAEMFDLCCLSGRYWLEEPGRLMLAGCIGDFARMDKFRRRLSRGDVVLSLHGQVIDSSGFDWWLEKCLTTHSHPTVTPPGNGETGMEVRETVNHSELWTWLNTIKDEGFTELCLGVFSDWYEEQNGDSETAAILRNWWKPSVLVVRTRPELTAPTEGDRMRWKAIPIPPAQVQTKENESADWPARMLVGKEYCRSDLAGFYDWLSRLGHPCVMKASGNKTFLYTARYEILLFSETLTSHAPDALYELVEQVCHAMPPNPAANATTGV